MTANRVEPAMRVGVHWPRTSAADEQLIEFCGYASTVGDGVEVADHVVTVRVTPEPNPRERQAICKVDEPEPM